MGTRRLKGKQQAADDGYIAWCPRCEKKGYATRQSTKKAVQRIHGREGHNSVYPCPHRSDLWHHGRLPRDVIAGDLPRADLRVRDRSA